MLNRIKGTFIRCFGTSGIVSRGAWIYTLVAVIAMVVATIITIGITLNNPKPVKSEPTAGQTINELFIGDSEEVQSYEDIKTYYYPIVDSNGVKTNFKDGNLAIEKIVKMFNDKLIDIHYRVCNIGIIGDTAFIQVDTRDSIEETLKANILTLQGSLDVSGWTKMLESLNETSKVYTSTLIDYPTEMGDTHYLYVYTEAIDDSGNKMNVTRDSNNIGTVE